MNSVSTRVTIAGNLKPTHVGQHFVDAARERGWLELAVELQDAFSGPALWRSASWRLLGHRPPALNRFNEELQKAVAEAGTRKLLTTGIAPITESTLRELKQKGVLTAVYLTDDPWNPGQAARWFFKALPHYDLVFTTRRANMEDLEQLGCSRVEYLPFAYAPSIHFVEEPGSAEERERIASDVVLVGGADADRVPLLHALTKEGLDVALYGQYWDRYAETKPLFRGYATPEIVRKAIAAAKISLCLVRRANRDGSSMRSFEVPAMGGCPLVEDTSEHRELFGEDGANVDFFSDNEEMVEKARVLSVDEERRKRLATNAKNLIRSGGHTYADRLEHIVNHMTVLQP